VVHCPQSPTAVAPTTSAQTLWKSAGRVTFVVFTQTSPFSGTPLLFVRVLYFCSVIEKLVFFISLNVDLEGVFNKCVTLNLTN